MAWKDNPMTGFLCLSRTPFTMPGIAPRFRLLLYIQLFARGRYQKEATVSASLQF